MEPIAEVLSATTPFVALDSAGLRDLAEKVKVRRYRKTEVIFREGEPATGLFVVESGQVKLTTYGPSRRRRLIGLVGPRQVFGEPGVVDHGPRAMDAEAMQDSVLVEVGVEAFWEAVEAHPALARRVIELMGQRLRRADRATQDLIFFDASGRVARKLLDLAEDYGEPTASGGIMIRTRITQRDLAQMLGMSRPNVNRLLTSFVGQGWIDWNDGNPILLRPDMLIRQAG